MVVVLRFNEVESNHDIELFFPGEEYAENYVEFVNKSCPGRFQRFRIEKAKTEEEEKRQAAAADSKWSDPEADPVY